ncbi:MAG: TrmB family transcriptional regulator [Candidatus Thorarchaeota archaeon]
MTEKESPSDSFSDMYETELKMARELVRVLSITQNEARIYLALLKEEMYTANQLSQATGIHRSRIYDNLRSLESKKLVVRRGSEPLLFSAAPLDGAIDHRLNEMATEYKRGIHETKTLGRELELIKGRREKLPSTSGTYLIQLIDIVDELSNLLTTTKSRMWVCKRTAGGVVDWFALRDQLEQLNLKGVDIRFLSDLPVDFGYVSKIHPNVNLSFVIIDSVIVTFLSLESEYARVLITEDTNYISIFEKVFLGWWDSE